MIYLKVNLKKICFCFYLLTFSSLLFSSEVDRWLLPETHPIYPVLENLFPSREMFDSFETLEYLGFSSKAPAEGTCSWSILVLAHPLIEGYIIKKYPNHVDSKRQLVKYLRRLQGAATISQYIKEHELEHIVVPEKWLYRLPDYFNDPVTGFPGYLVIAEEFDLCPGGDWGGETLKKYQKMKEPVMRELCAILHDLRGCDASPQNQPFTRDGKIAFIDTEHLGRMPQDFMTRLIKDINPSLQSKAREIWDQLEAKKMRLQGE